VAEYRLSPVFDNIEPNIGFARLTVKGSLLLETSLFGIIFLCEIDTLPKCARITSRYKATSPRAAGFFYRRSIGDSKNVGHLRVSEYPSADLCAPVSFASESDPFEISLE